MDGWAPARRIGLHVSGPRPREPTGSVSKDQPLKREPSVVCAFSLTSLVAPSADALGKMILEKHLEGQSMPGRLAVTRPRPTTVTANSAPNVPPGSTYVGPNAFASSSSPQPAVHASTTT